MDDAPQVTKGQKRRGKKKKKSAQARVVWRYPQPRVDDVDEENVAELTFEPRDVNGATQTTTENIDALTKGIVLTEDGRLDEEEDNVALFTKHLADHRDDSDSDSDADAS